jgi:hypothetical protein
MRSLVEALCSEATAGRKPGTPEGLAARTEVIGALRGAGLDPFEQAIPGSGGGANILTTIPGEIDRWVLIAAHYDHLGKIGRDVYWGAGDNAAAVAILVEVARSLNADRAGGRGVVIAAFDTEEPPYYLSNAMGSMRYARDPVVPLERTDMMVCMDLVGHAMGPEHIADDVRDTVFALGAEKSAGTPELVRDIAVDGVVVRPADVDLVPPLSDYHAFYQREVPFLFLSSGRSRHYHAPTDTPETLDYDKMAATARWLEAYVRRCCERDGPIEFTRRVDDRSTVESLLAMLEPLAELSDQAQVAREMARELLDLCDADGALPPGRSADATALALGLESALA